VILRRGFAAAGLLALLLSAASSEPAYPLLASLGPDDLIFQQQQEQLAASYAALERGLEPPELLFYSYSIRTAPSRDGASAKGAVDLYSLAARLNLPYETIATLNGLDRIREFLPGERLLVPSAPGLFLPEEPSSDLEFLVSYRGSSGSRLVQASGRRFHYYPGARFNPEERALFLGVLFRFPLPAGRLSSGFGLRESPISGRMSKHAGIDLAAPAGTDVYAAREGRVAEAGFDSTLGQYLVIEHEGGYSTVYGHLSLRRVRLNEEVESGMIIGSVGSTGLSTGPHLHFEVRNRGEPRDPQPLIPRGNR